MRDQDGRTVLDVLLYENRTEVNVQIANDLIRQNVKMHERKTDSLLLLNAWVSEEQEKAKLLIKLGASIECAENLFEKSPLLFQKRRASWQDQFNPQPKKFYLPTLTSKIAKQIELSKQFISYEQAKWLGVAAACVCFEGGIEETLLKTIIVY